METYLYEISKCRPEVFIGYDIIDECKSNMAQFVKSSTSYYFKDSHFYKELPQVLKRKLVNWVLYK